MSIADEPAGRGASSPCRRAALASLAILSLSAPAAFAQTPADTERELEQIESVDLDTLMSTPVDVWTPSKIPQKYYEAPAITTTITREQIAVWGWKTVAELLGHVLGFYIVDDHITPNVAVRGSSGGLYAESSIIKVLIDGHSVSFASTGGNALGPELIPISAIDRVEIVRGPASSLYGADAFLGVVNIQTRRGRNINGVDATVGAGWTGSHPANDVDLSLGMSRRTVQGMAAFRWTRQDLSGLLLPESSPAPAIPVYNLGSRAARHLDQTSYTGIGTLTWRPRADKELGLFAYLSAMERGAEFGSLFQLPSGYNDRGVYSENRVSRWQFRTGLLWNQTLARSLSLSFRGAYFQGGPLDDNRLEVGSEFFYVQRRFGFRGTDMDLHLVWTPADALRLVGGLSLLVDGERLPSRIVIAKQSVEGVEPGGVIEANSIRGGLKTFINAGAYLQGTWDVLGPRLGITGGLRYDQHNIYGIQLSRRVGLVSSVWPNLHAKLLHGSAFKAPSPLLLYAVPAATGDVVGNAALEPQFINTVELQIEYAPSSRLTASTALVYNRLDNKTEFIQEGGNKAARNVARATTVSWESQIDLERPRWLHTHLSLELLHTVQRTHGDDFVAEVLNASGSIYPQAMVHADVAVQPPGAPLRGAVMASYVGSRRASGNNALLHGGPYQLPPYVLLDVTLSTTSFPILRGAPQEISFQLLGKNLLGASGPAPGFSGVDYPLSPRGLLFQVTVGL